MFFSHILIEDCLGLKKDKKVMALRGQLFNISSFFCHMIPSSSFFKTTAFQFLKLFFE
jgi:hypothetical protein